MHKGEVMREERNKQGLTQEQLASITGLSRRYISFFENGREIPQEHLESIADALDSYRLKLAARGNALPCYLLNLVDDSPVAAKQKAIEELEEALQALKELDLVNKTSAEDLTEEDIAQLKVVLLELYDLDNLADNLFVFLQEHYDLDLEATHEEWKHKSINKGYMSEGMTKACAK